MKERYELVEGPDGWGIQDNRSEDFYMTLPALCRLCNLYSGALDEWVDAQTAFTEANLAASAGGGHSRAALDEAIEKAGQTAMRLVQLTQRDDIGVPKESQQ